MPLPAAAAAGFFVSVSAETLKRSRTSPVFIDPRPAFCCVTTDEAMLSLNRCSLIVSHVFTLDSPHDLLLQCAPCDEAVDVDDLLLTETMRAVHGLQILHRVPVVVDKDDRVGSSKVES